MKSLYFCVIILFLVSCQDHNNNVSLNDENEVKYLIDSLESEIKLCISFEKVNIPVYNNVSKYQDLSDIFAYNDVLPLKDHNTIFFEDFVFLSYSYKASYQRTMFANKIADSIHSLIFNASKPLFYASSCCYHLANQDYYSMAGTIAGQYSKQFRNEKQDRLYYIMKDYYGDVYYIQMRSKEEIKERISNIMYIEYGTFDNDAFDDWYYLVDRQYKKFVQSNKNSVEKLARVKELNIH